jgi:hypothetical protein
MEYRYIRGWFFVFFRSLGRSREDVAKVIRLEDCSGVGAWYLELVFGCSGAWGADWRGEEILCGGLSKEGCGIGWQGQCGVMVDSYTRHP